MYKLMFRTFIGLCRIMRTMPHCSTVVRNIVLRATIKVNGKPPTLGIRSFQTLKSIDLKFDLNNYVGSVTLRAQNGTNRPSKSGGTKR